MRWLKWATNKPRVSKCACVCVGVRGVIIVIWVANANTSSPANISDNALCEHTQFHRNLIPNLLVANKERHETVNKSLLACFGSHAFIHLFIYFLAVHRVQLFTWVLYLLVVITNWSICRLRHRCKYNWGHSSVHLCVRVQFVAVSCLLS